MLNTSEIVAKNEAMFDLFYHHFYSSYIAASLRIWNLHLRHSTALSNVK